MFIIKDMNPKKMSFFSLYAFFKCDKLVLGEVQMKKNKEKFKSIYWTDYWIIFRRNKRYGNNVSRE